MRVSQSLVGLLASCCILHLAHAGDDDELMEETIVVTAKRPIPMSYSAPEAAEPAPLAVDFSELALTPPRLERRGRPGRSARDLASAEPDKRRS